MDKQDLLDLKKEIDEAKEARTKLEGKQEHMMEQLKEKYKCSTIKEAKEKLGKLKTRIDKLNTSIDESVESLKALLPNKEDDEN